MLKNNISLPLLRRCTEHGRSRVKGCVNRKFMTFIINKRKDFLRLSDFARKLICDNQRYLRETKNK
ncbi:MAG: hypothetical protein CVT95_11930 [Bacteroidetes bacterium HGW-Bacteroidetes-12]|nr:MAG: hypothetical protein CVT95_11930 [Bacteroidetes bacterium HGW-Bacteroidetes-12]